MTETDEDGHFRFPNLMRERYYVAAGPLVAEQLLAAGEKPKTGFAHVYYPGAPDLASALPIQLSGGQQTEADFSLSAVPVYQVSGSISGHLPDQGVGFQLLTSSGDELSLPTTFNMETGTFKLEGLPAGSYIVQGHFAGRRSADARRAASECRSEYRRPAARTGAHRLHSHRRSHGIAKFLERE